MTMKRTHPRTPNEPTAAPYAALPGATAGAPVVVGVDGSDASARALAWGVREALHEHRAVRVVHAWEPMFHAYAAPVVEVDVDVARETAQQLLDAAVAAVHALAPGLAVTSALVRGPTGRALLDEAADASIMVLGGPVRSPIADVVLGSVALFVTAHAHVPVVVVRDRLVDADWTEGRVVVGVDGSAASERALAFAFEAAARRSHELTVVHAWDMPAPFTAPELTRALAEAGDLAERARMTMSQTLAGWEAKYPDVAVRVVLSRAHPVDALVDEATGAALLVVASRGRGGFRGMMLGSVSQALLRHAPCPVGVVRR